MNKLNNKTIISGRIKVITGLHIGGSSSAMEIGGLDQNNIIKTANGIPYIPGSSLKGKLRNMLAKVTGSTKVGDNAENDFGTTKLFGVGANDTEGYSEAYLRVRDAYLVKKSVENFDMDFEYSEVKYENTIDRIKGSANPRPLERVPSGAEFEFEMIYDCFDNESDKDDLKKISFAMQLLEQDSLGGSGSRGSGKIRFFDVKLKNVEIDIDKSEINQCDIVDEKDFDCFKINKDELELIEV